MLRAILLAGLLAAPVSSAAMFVPARRRLRTAGAWPASRRFVTALLGTLLLDGLLVAFLRVLDVSRSDALVAAIAVAVTSLFWMPATRRWNARAHLCWASCLLLYVGYLSFILDWTLRSHLGVGSTIGGIILWLLELVAGLLASAYLWELCDALGTEHWRRRIRRGMATVAPPGYEPFVSLHVPAHNEPPEMVIETLTSLLHLDYANYEIIAIDDNSDDPQLWHPVDEWCARHGVKFVHLSDWPGYKSGALNVALRRLTNESAELIAVVDSDYQIEPQFLRRCTGLFADPHVGFIQAPQDYRDWAQAPYYRRLYYSYKYFFAVSQPSRNERDAAIFAGTMGLIRKSALESVGGWDEWCITEDAELSLRLLRAGWSGLHVDESWGHGVMPLTFEALKSQRYRWCFGGIQILRMHHPDPADALALFATGTFAPEQPADAGAAVGLLRRRIAVVRRPARLAVLRVPARRRGQPGNRRGPAVPQTHGLPGRRDPGTGSARTHPGSRPDPARNRRHLARRHRRVLHLAIHIAGGRPRLGTGPVRPTRSLPANPEDIRPHRLVAGRADELGRVAAGRARPRRHRRRPLPDRHPQRTTSRRAARRTHVRLRGRAAEQPGRAARRTPAGASATATD